MPENPNPPVPPETEIPQEEVKTSDKQGKAGTS